VQLYLIRHPRPAVAPGICYGHTDLDLADDVAVCAQRLAPRLPHQAPLYSSPLMRCEKLANVLSSRPRVDGRLQEMNFGAWEMQPWDQIGAAALADWAAAPLDFVPPGGESVAALSLRVTAFMDELCARGHRAVILVTHAGVMKVLAAQSRNLPQAEWLGLQFEYGELVEISWPRDQTILSQS
jgi:alpha-ribazole phosphatase